MGIRTVFFVLATSTLVAACTPPPQVELDAYIQSFDDTRSVSNDVLDLVAAYERRTYRAVALAAPSDDDDLEALLLAPPDAAAVASAKPQSVQICEDHDRLGPDEYCFELRQAYATIGDPPLTAAFRRTLSVIHRYNALLVAYAEGRSGDILAAELGALQSDINAGLSAGSVAVPQIDNAFALLQPLASFVGSTGDRERFRTFLLDNYAAVDDALEALMRGTEVLYDNIAQDVLARSVRASAAEDAELHRQLEQSRQVLANLTYLFEDTRTMLSELVLAVENPDSLESRLRNLGLTSLDARVDAEEVRRGLTQLVVGAP